MPKDIERELDSIFAHHNARVAEARGATSGKSAAAEEFTQAAALCIAEVIIPALQQMAEALRQRGVAAKVVNDAGDARIDIPVSRHARLGHGHGGYPYLRARADRSSRRIHFERNTSDGRGGNAVRDCALAEITGESVKSLVLDLVRQIYGPL
jgi:hypothetical protein